jgi:hypothetical protein
LASTNPNKEGSVCDSLGRYSLKLHCFLVDFSSCFKSDLVDVFVALGRHSHIGLGVDHVGIFVGTHIAFLLCENPFYIELGLGIVIVGALHPLGGTNNFDLMLSLVGASKLTFRFL